MCRKLHLFLEKSTKTAATRAALFDSNMHQIFAPDPLGDLLLVRLLPLKEKSRRLWSLMLICLTTGNLGNMSTFVGNVGYFFHSVVHMPRKMSIHEIGL